ncbi:MAG: hypothetical protein ACM3UN_04005 [Bacillota bacterium]
MAIKKSSHRNLYLAILLIVILSVATAAIVYATLPSPKKATAGVHVGDSFTYSITGILTLQSTEATATPGFEQYNQTDYYKVTITGVTGENVTFDTQWRFLNGTAVDTSQSINLSNGQESVQNGFWAMYSSNLKKGDLLRPTGFDKQIVNETAPQQYADSTRERNFWFIESQFEDTRDPTHSTLMDVFNQIYFDKQTGMLDTLNSISYYNNPLKTEAIIWKLVSCTVWDV